jgi:Lipocalin-like domain
MINALAQKGRNHHGDRKVIASGIHRGWELVPYVVRPEKEDPTCSGNVPERLIMYTPDGFKSAQLMRLDRPEFVSGTWFDATDDELRAGAE